MTAIKFDGFAVTQTDEPIATVRMEEVLRAWDDEKGLRLGKITVDGDGAI